MEIESICAENATCGKCMVLIEEGRFEKYVPENSAKISEVFRNIDPNGFYHTTSSGQVVLSYSTAKVKAEEA